jgi:hypothetical protein
VTEIIGKQAVAIRQGRLLGAAARDGLTWI